MSNVKQTEAMERWTRACADANVIRMVAYLDCAATTPMEPEVVEIMLKYMTEEFGNAGSRTHEYGLRAKKAVELARRQVAEVVAADPDEIVFTSGATESNNLAILGLAPYAERTGKRHIVTTAIEHKAVLEPVAHLERKGFEVTRIMPTRDGFVLAEEVLAAVRDDTALVSVMHANNETGILQPIEDIAAGLANREAFFHVDAAQTFGKLIPPLQNKRIDMISASAHKIYGPKGVGALVTRRREYKRPPLEPLMFGGGQERGLRPGTLPVFSLCGFGIAARTALRDCAPRTYAVQKLMLRLRANLESSPAHIIGLRAPNVGTVAAIELPIDSEAALLVLKPIAACSNGAACSSNQYAPSHVYSLLTAHPSRVLRLSWDHKTNPDAMERSIQALGVATLGGANEDRANEQAS
jgi:cysteine desulfurase